MAYSALIDDLERQFAENPRRVFARLANEYRKSGELERAIEICQVHVPQQPGYISGYIVMGQALFESGRMDEAHATFQTALDLDPENLIALRHLGDIARQTGDLSGARIWYQRLLEIDPQNEEIALQLSELSPASPPPVTSAEEAVPATMTWGEINPEQEPAAEAAPEAPLAAPELSADAELDIVAHGHEEPSQAHGVDALAEHEPLDLHEETSVLDAHLAAAMEPPRVDHSFLDARSEQEDTHHDFGPGEIVPERDPFAEADELRPPSIAELSFDDDGVVELASFEAREMETAEAGEAEEPRAHRDEPAFAAPDEPRDGSPAEFVTETMAELYLEQGYRQEALHIFRQLSEQDPNSEELRSRIRRLADSDVQQAHDAREPVVAATPARARPERTIRHFLAAFADRRPPRAPAPREPMEAPTWRGGSDSRASSHEEEAAHSLAAAFSEDYLNRRAGASGQPARVASNELSLDQVFRSPRAGEEGAGSRAVSFDEFFSPRSGEAATQADTAHGAQPEQPKPSSDLELFHAWLEGLKK